MALPESGSFRALMVARGAATLLYARTIEGFAAVDVLVEIERLGDLVLRAVRTGRVESSVAEGILAQLTEAFVDPIGKGNRAILIGQQIEEFGNK